MDGFCDAGSFGGFSGTGESDDEDDEDEDEDDGETEACVALADELNSSEPTRMMLPVTPLAEIKKPPGASDGTSLRLAKSTSTDSSRVRSDPVSSSPSWCCCGRVR